MAKILDDLKKRFASRANEQLADERDRLQVEFNELRRAPLAAELLAGVDARTEEHRATLERELDASVYSIADGSCRLDYLERFGTLAALADVSYPDAVRAAVERAGLLLMSPAERDKKLEKLAREVAACEAELDRRAFEQEQKERDAAVEARLDRIAAKVGS
jgi:hypothetical protein